MNKTFSLERIARTGSLHANLILRQDDLGLRAPFVEIKSINLKMKRKEIAKEIGYSSSTKQRFRSDTKMQSNFKSNKPKTHQGPQMASKDLK